MKRENCRAVEAYNSKTELLKQNQEKIKTLVYDMEAVKNQKDMLNVELTAGKEQRGKALVDYIEMKVLAENKDIEINCLKELNQTLKDKVNRLESSIDEGALRASADERAAELTAKNNEIENLKVQLDQLNERLHGNQHEEKIKEYENKIEELHRRLMEEEVKITVVENRHVKELTAQRSKLEESLEAEKQKGIIANNRIKELENASTEDNRIEEMQITLNERLFRGSCKDERYLFDSSRRPL